MVLYLSFLFLIFFSREEMALSWQYGQITFMLRIFRYAQLNSAYHGFFIFWITYFFFYSFLSYNRDNYIHSAFGIFFNCFRFFYFFCCIAFYCYFFIKAAYEFFFFYFIQQVNIPERIGKISIHFSRNRQPALKDIVSFAKHIPYGVHGLQFVQVKIFLCDITVKIFLFLFCPFCPVFRIVFFVHTVFLMQKTLKIFHQRHKRIIPHECFFYPAVFFLNKKHLVAYRNNHLAAFF